MNGLLLTMTEPPAQMEEEFNIALYELTDRAAIKSAQWQAAVATPWSKRMLAATAAEEWILRCYDAYDAGETKP